MKGLIAAVLGCLVCPVPSLALPSDAASGVKLAKQDGKPASKTTPKAASKNAAKPNYEVGHNAASAKRSERPKLAPVFSSLNADPVLLQPQEPVTLKSAAEGSAVSHSPVVLSHGLAPDTPFIDCTLPVESVGSLNFSDATAIIRGGSVEIKNKSVTTDVPPYLLGKVVRLDDTSSESGALRQMSGLVVFQEGSMLPLLDEQGTHQGATEVPPREDLVFRKEGSVSGQIIAVEGDLLLVRRQTEMLKVPISSISYVRSNRAFVFTISGKASSDLSRTRVSSVTFQPTTTAVNMGDSLVVGRQPDSLDDPLDDLVQPAVTTPMRRFSDDGGIGGREGRPFSTWP